MNLEDVWAQYRQRIKAFLHSKISNPADVEDLLQEISIKVFTGLSGLQDDTKVQSWLFQTANRTIMDFYRKSGHHKELHPDDLWFGEDDPAVIIELERCIEPFIAALPDETGRMLTEIDLEGKSQKEYAREKGIAYSTLKSRVQSARADLRAVFENCCEMSIDAGGNIFDIRRKTGGCENC